MEKLYSWSKRSAAKLARGDKRHSWGGNFILESVYNWGGNFILESVYSSSGSNQLEECIDIVPCKVTADMVETFSSEFSAEEIKTTLFQMGPTKVPKPDGMNAIFY